MRSAAWSASPLSLTALAHFSLYVVDQRYDLLHVASEIVLRFYLTIGFVALVGLATLAATSTDAMIRRVGAQNWNRLHKLVYPIAPLALLHFFCRRRPTSPSRR